MESSASQVTESTASVWRPEFSKEQEATILRAACRRVVSAVRRETAEPARKLLGELADTAVYGAFVTLRRAGQLRSCCGYIGEAVFLGEAVDCAADRAATDDPRFPPISPNELHELDVDVWVLWGPEVVTARGEDRVKAVIIGKHGLLVSRGNARGLLLPGVAVDHNLDALAFLQQVCIKAGLPTDAWKDDKTQLQVFEGDSIHGRLQPESPDVRPPAVAGAFYPDKASEVQHMVNKLFAAAPSAAIEPWAGAMVPHAGWIYSGRLAAAVFNRVEIPDCAIILCPKHRAPGAPWAVAPHARWQFPGGELASDPELAARLAAGVDGLKLDAEAHREEHAIEVELPLLAKVAPQVRVVGIVVGDSSLPELLRFGQEMSAVLREMPQRPLLIISSDMNHFADVDYTRRVDRIALDAIATLDPSHVYETVRKNRISMCGMAPCVVVMETLRQLGCLNRCDLVGYATSGDTNGSMDRVVGYAGLLFR